MNCILRKNAASWSKMTLIQHRLQIFAVISVGLQTESAQPIIAAKHPFKVEVKSGKRYSWCACGHSKNQPFCDGTHKTMAPKISPLRFTPEKDCTLWLCGCKHSSNAPYCDGTHKQEFIQKAELLQVLRS